MKMGNVPYIKEGGRRPQDEAVEQVEYYIQSEGLSPHTRLPSERDMFEMWGLSRTTLRKALEHLRRVGKLYSRRGAGNYVAPGKLLCNLQDFHTVSDAARAAGRRLETKVLVSEVIECNKHLSRKLQLPLGRPVFVLSRLRVADGIPLGIEISYLDHTRYPQLSSRDFGQDSLYRALREDWGTKLYNGTESLGITYANEAEAAALDVPDQTPLFFLSGVSLDADGTPVEYFKAITRPDMVQYANILT